MSGGCNNCDCRIKITVKTKIQTKENDPPTTFVNKLQFEKVKQFQCNRILIIMLSTLVGIEKQANSVYCKVQRFYMIVLFT